MHRFIFLLIAALFALVSAAHAHPHAWISVRTTIILNDNRDAVAVREYWLFDKMYSAYATADFDPHKNGKLLEKDLLSLAEQNVHNLKDYNYFTAIEDANGQPVTFDTARDIASTLQTPTENNQGGGSTKASPDASQSLTPVSLPQISMSFTIPLKKPINLRTGTMVYRIFDPTYYTDMTHIAQKPVTFVEEKSGAEITTCHSAIAHPTVDEKMLFTASALDQNATAPSNLGYYFSQKVTASCP